MVARITTAHRSQRGTQVAALVYTLCENARLAGIDPQASLLRAIDAPWRSLVFDSSR